MKYITGKNTFATPNNSQTAEYIINLLGYSKYWQIQFKEVLSCFAADITKHIDDVLLYIFNEIVLICSAESDFTHWNGEHFGDDMIFSLRKWETVNLGFDICQSVKTLEIWNTVERSIHEPQVLQPVTKT